MWDDLMIKELKSLAELGSFVMIRKPRAATVLQKMGIQKQVLPRCYFEKIQGTVLCAR